MNTIFFEKNCDESLSITDLEKISYLFSAVSLAFKNEEIDMSSCQIGKNNQYGNIYIYSEDLPVSVYINENNNTIIWVVIDYETGEEYKFNTYSLAKQFINNKL